MLWSHIMSWAWDKEKIWVTDGDWTGHSAHQWNAVKNRVRTHLESPWKSLSFKIKIQGLESPWKLQSALESPWISVLTLSNTDSQVSKRSKHRKTYQGKIAHVVEEPKKTDSRLFFALNGVLEKWEMSPWKSLKFLEFFVLKRVRTLKEGLMGSSTIMYML